MAAYESQYFQEVYDRAGEVRRISEIRVDILLDRYPSIRTVLDVGCGPGDVLEFAEKRGVESTGVDISKFALDKARKRVRGRLKRVDVGSQPLPFSDKEFDAVVSFDLIEHLISPDNFLSEVSRVLRPRGIFFITTPNRQRIRWLTTRIFPDDPTHINVQGGAYWFKKLSDAGFAGITVRGAILHGLPPLPSLRRLFTSVGLPNFVGPIFTPVIGLSGTLYILARKRG